MRTAEDVLLICWPPAPLERYILKRTDRYTPNHLMLMLAELGDVEVCQMVDTYMTMRFGFEKRIAPDLKF